MLRLFLRHFTASLRRQVLSSGHRAQAFPFGGVIGSRCVLDLLARCVEPIWCDVTVSAGEEALHRGLLWDVTGSVESLTGLRTEGAACAENVCVGRMVTDDAALAGLNV